MPQRVVPLAQDLAGRFEVAGRDGSEPKERHVAARGVRVGQGEPFAHGCRGRGPGQGGAEAEGVDDGDGFVGVWVLGKEGVESFVEWGGGWAGGYWEEEVGCACSRVKDRSGLRLDRCEVCVDVELTGTEIGASMSAVSIVLDHLFAARDDVFGAVGLDELIVASAAAAFGPPHLPLLQAAQRHVLTEEDVERCVDVLEQVVSDEDDAIESV